MKRATFQGVVAYDGGSLLVRSGQRFDDRHPLVEQRPDLFVDEASTDDDAVVQAPRVETTMQHPAGQRSEARPNRVPRGGTGQ